MIHGAFPTEFPTDWKMVGNPDWGTRVHVPERGDSETTSLIRLPTAAPPS